MIEIGDLLLVTASALPAAYPIKLFFLFFAVKLACLLHVKKIIDNKMT